jgi:hypothetical protein
MDFRSIPHEMTPASMLEHFVLPHEYDQLLRLGGGQDGCGANQLSYLPDWEWGGTGLPAVFLCSQNLHHSFNFCTIILVILGCEPMQHAHYGI